MRVCMDINMHVIAHVFFAAVQAHASPSVQAAVDTARQVAEAERVRLAHVPRRHAGRLVAVASYFTWDEKKKEVTISEEVKNFIYFILFHNSNK